MAWVTPSLRADGDLIIDDYWNELVNDLRFLKGKDGTITLEDGLVTQELTPDTHNTYDIGADATRYQDLYLEGNADVDGTLNVEGAVTLQSTANVQSTLTTRGIVPNADNTYDIGANANRYKDFYLEGNADIDGTLNVQGAVTLQSTADVQSTLTTRGVLPNADATYNIGSAAAKFKTAYLSQYFLMGDTVNLQEVLSGATSVLHLARNAYYDGAWKRRYADVDACTLALDSDGSLRFYTNSDVQNTANSAITFVKRFELTNAGLVQAKLPTVAARVGADILNVVGDATVYQVVYDTEDLDNASAFNAGTGTFAAPVAGVYNFSGTLRLVGLPGPTTAEFRVRLVTTGRTVELIHKYLDTSGSSLTEETFSYAVNVPMALSDTAYVDVLVSSGAGVKNIDIGAGSTFGAHLVATT